MFMHEKTALEASLVSNIFGKPEDYRIHFDGIYYLVFDPISYSIFPTEKRAKDWIVRRTTERLVPARIYSDICRCGSLKHNWDYYTTNGLKFERCNLCNNPLRHSVMLEINRDLLADFDLEAFLGL